MQHDYNNDQQTGTTFSISGMGFGNNAAVTHSYKITVKGDDGTTFDWDISSDMYDQINIGDKLVKHPGTKIPEIVAKASAPKATEKPDASQSTPPSSTPPVIQ